MTSGTAAVVQPNAGTLNINQSTNKAIINWQSFSVGQGGTVNFNQPNSSSATLNRVLGSTPSNIAGAINAPGTVLLVNPNGVAITKDGVIKTGSFAASTLDIKDSDFLAGNYKFTGSGGSAAVTNAGRINVSDGGFAALLGGQVANSGVISARLGKVGLGAGELITLDFAGDGFLSVAVPSSELGKLVDPNGALVTNSGKIRANGGQVYLRAATAANILRDAVNVPGSIRANSVGTHNGKIVLGGGAGGKVNVSGRLTAKGKRNAGLSAGGKIDISGRDIALTGARLDVSGGSAGGGVRIGGDAHGAGAFEHAQSVSIDSTSVIRADAMDAGNGGSIAVWSDGLTSVGGTLSARGGPNGGIGGFIETSGHTLSIAGVRVNAGVGGQWLLDPYDLTVDAAAATSIDAALGAGTDVTLQTTASSSSGFGVVNTAGLGDITIASALSWNSTATLTLDAYNAIAVNAPINILGAGKLALNAAYDTTTVAGASLLKLSFAQGASVSYAETSPGSGTGIAGQALTINGQGYNLVYSLSAIAGLDASSGRHDALALSLTSTGTYGSYLVNQYQGIFDGLGNTISDLKIGSSGGASIINLLFNGGTLRNIGLAGDTVFTNDFGYAGSLVGQNEGVIQNVFSNATISSGSGGGGIVGANFGPGTIINAHFTGSITGSSYVGGIAGTNDGTMTQVFSSGAISTNNSYAGGLVGLNDGLISSSYSTGHVVTTLANGGGGLAGISDVSSYIVNSYWDTETSGQTRSDRASSQNASIYGLTTAQFQSGSASGLGSAFAGGTGGLYPYLKNFLPNGAQAVSGIAYKDGGATVAASGSAGAVTVWLDAGGGQIGSATTGANGYYYIAVANGTLTNGASVLATTAANGSFSVNAATLATSAGATAQTGVNLYGNALTVSTAATLLSSAPDHATIVANMQAVGGAAADAVVAATTGTGYIATGAGFTIDQALTLNGGLLIKTTAANADITIGGALTFTGASGLTLNATGNVLFNADVTVAGGGAVSLAYGGDYLLNGHSLSFTGGSGAGASLALNGVGYTLLYSMADVDGIDGVAASGNAINTQAGGLSGHYALASNLIATGTTYTDALVGVGSTSADLFTGTFEGLGHTITGLTVNKTSGAFTGLFGYSTGTIRDIGLVGGSITGYADVGGLVGYNTGTIAQAYATGTVAGVSLAGGSTNYNAVGGLVGYNRGTITQSYATGAVSGHFYIGGLVGEFASGTITQSYATGAVSGVSSVGGLAGESYGTITRSYATGAVNGVTSVGGLVGDIASGTVTQAYATGAVNGIGAVGGLVGYNFAGAITQSYATGAVSGQSSAGGLVGDNDTGGTVTNGYYDSGTSGQANGIGHDSNSQTVTALTTAQFQSGTLPSGFDSTVWATGSGLYPYLKSFFPNGVQAVSGFAYKDAGATLLASGVSGAAYVSAMADGVSLGSVTTGANGYYYVLTSAGTFSPGNRILAYTTLNPTTGAANGATVASATSAANQASLNIYGNTLTGMTTATLLSAAPTLAQAQTDAIAAAYGDTGALAAIGGTSGRGLIGAGASFTIDQAVTASGILVLATADGTPLTVAQPINILGTGSVGLMSGGALVINAPVTVAGAGSLALGAGYDTTTVPGRSLLELSFGNGATIDYGATDNGGALSLNGAAYTLLYSMADVDGIDGVAASGNAINTQAGGLSGHYALASSLIATGTTYTDALVGVGSTSADLFTGTFEGLGHTITGLTVNKTSGAFTGLFGYSTGTIRDIGLVGGSITGYADVGGLVGYNTGAIAQAYATGTVAGVSLAGGSTNYNAVGGLVGYNRGTITQSYATGAVSGHFYIGGLVGEFASGTITQSYATGAVSGVSSVGGLAGESYGTITRSYATGAVNGSDSVGGLVGDIAFGTVTRSYATGAVSGTGNIGGLVGYNFSGTITQSYATGAVSGGGSGIGGLVGDNDTGGTVANSYWDTYATGQVSGFGVNNGTVTNLVSVTSDPGQSASASYAFTQSAYGNLNFGADWFMIDGQTRPFGQWEHTTTIINTHQLQLMSMDLNASYTLGANIDATETFGANPSGMWTTAGFVPVGTGSGFSGSLDGQSFTISNLSIVRPSEDNIGLIGTLYGTVSNVGLIGAEITGHQNVGALIGSNFGIVSNSYAAVDVCGCGEVYGLNSVGGLVGQSLGQISGSHSTMVVVGFGNSVGGLVGFAGAGSIDTSYAAGTVHGDLVTATNVGGLIGSTNPGVTVSNSYATGAVEGNTAVGGLVGYNLATVTQSYARGNVRGTDKIGGLVGWNDATGSLQRVFADGLVGGVSSANSTNVGGLVGQNDGSVTDAYATGAVAGDDFVGGLIGRNGVAGSVTNAYAAGWVTFVNGSTSNFGALAGANQGTITNTYWNTQTSGQATAIGVDSGSSNAFGDTTALLEAALPAGFDSSIWGIISGVSTPYMNWRFPNGPTVVSGTAAGFTGGNAGLVVGVAIDGTVLPTNAATGADGSYLFMLDPAAAGGAAFTWLTRDYFPNGSSRPSNAVADLVSSAPGFAQGQATGLDFAPDRVLTVASNAIVDMNGVIALMERALYGPTLSTSVPIELFNIGYDPVRIVRFDASTSLSALAFTPLGGADFRLQSAAANMNLNEPLGCSCDLNNLEVIGSGNLVISQPIIAGGRVLMTAPGDMTIDSTGYVSAGATGDAIVLAAGGNFINEAGATALDLADPTGRWLVYSSAPAGDTFGNLDSGNSAIWNTTYPTAVAASGNRYVFAAQPTLTFTSTGVLTKTYGDDATAAVAASSYSVSGYQSVAGAFNDDASVYSGAPTLTSTGSGATVNVAATPYGITIAAGTLTSLNGYAFAFASAGNGTLTVNPATLTIAAATDTKTYDGNSSSVGVPIVASGLVNGDSAGGFMQAFLSKNVLGLNGSTLAVDAGSGTVNDGNNGANYTLVYQTAAGTITPATLTITAVTNTKTYDGNTSAVGTPTVSGLKGSDTATGLVEAYANAGVGTDKTLSVTGYTINDGNRGANYAVQTVTDGTGVINSTPTDPTSHVNPPGTGGTNPGVNITFQNPTGGPINISFTPPRSASNDNGSNVTPAALPDGVALATNHGLTFLPISQFDQNQYSQFKLPDYADRAGEAAVFTMIARGVDAQHGSDYMIDTFWNGASGVWDASAPTLSGKVTFSDGAGNTVVPGEFSGFPIVPGTTDFSQMLLTGPLLISGGGQPAHWLLATQMTADGKGIVANDPATGKQVLLSFDPGTKTVGGVTGIFDAKTKTFIALADAAAGAPADAGLSGLQGFGPQAFIAVGLK